MMRKIGRRNDLKIRVKQKKMLIAYFNEVETVHDVEILVNTIFTTSEIEAIAQRISILKFMNDGAMYHDIENYMGVSPSTISRALDGYHKHGQHNRKFNEMHKRVEENNKFRLVEPIKPKKERSGFYGGTRQILRENKRTRDKKK